MNGIDFLQKGFAPETEIIANILGHFKTNQSIDPNLKVVEADDLEKGVKLYSTSDVSDFQGKLDELIKKGEDEKTPLTDEEFAYLEKGMKEIKALNKVILKKGSQVVEVFM